VEGVRATAISQLQPTISEIQLHHREADVGALVEELVHGAVEFGEQLLNRVTIPHLRIQHPAEHHHRNCCLHCMARYVGHADRQLTVLLEILEKVATDMIGGDTVPRNVEAFDLMFSCSALRPISEKPM